MYSKHLCKQPKTYNICVYIYYMYCLYLIYQTKHGVFIQFLLFTILMTAPFEYFQFPVFKIILFLFFSLFLVTSVCIGGSLEGKWNFWGNNPPSPLLNFFYSDYWNANKSLLIRTQWHRNWLFINSLDHFTASSLLPFCKSLL